MEFVKVVGLVDEEGILLVVKGEDDVYVVVGEKGEVSFGEVGDEL